MKIKNINFDYNEAGYINVPQLIKVLEDIKYVINNHDDKNITLFKKQTYNINMLVDCEGLTQIYTAHPDCKTVLIEGYLQLADSRNEDVAVEIYGVSEPIKFKASEKTGKARPIKFKKFLLNMSEDMHINLSANRRIIININYKLE